MRDVFEVVTPENVPFEFELAGLATRAFALGIDVAVLAAVLTGVAALVSLVGLASGGVATALYFVAIFLAQWGYGTLLEWRLRGQTLGKRMVGIRVLDRSGVEITFLQALVRNVVRIVDMAPFAYLFGGLTALLDDSGRRLGDIAAGSVVVKERTSPRPALIQAPSQRYNSFLEDPAVVLAARRISAPEREAMVALSLRRESLPLPVRHALFKRLGDHLEARLGVARPSFFSHERFVLHLTTVALAQARARPLSTPAQLGSTAVAP